ncbi:MAG: hypothetical protein RL641_81 [Candidatus Parcubacteria bacterium]|jgi:hypothetical protein
MALPTKDTSDVLQDYIHAHLPDVEHKFYLSYMCLTTKVKHYLLDRAYESKNEAFFFLKEIAHVRQIIEGLNALSMEKYKNISSLEVVHHCIKYLKLITCPLDSIEMELSLFFKAIYDQITLRTERFQNKVLASCIYQLRKLLKKIITLVGSLAEAFPQESSDAFLIPLEVSKKKKKHSRNLMLQ